MKVDVLGVPFDNVTMEEAAALAASRMGGEGGIVVTANPEILLLCREREDYAAAVRSADLILPDGIGDLYAARLLRRPLKERVPGADLVPRLLRELSERGGSVFLFGARPGTAERAAQAIVREWPGLRIAGTENGYSFREEELLSCLREKKPELLLVALGAPKQELWMAAHRRELPGTLMIGVGGVLDVLAGDVHRAPPAMRRAGLEWLYRLCREPKRLGRMIRLPKVLLLALRERSQ